MTNNLDDFAVFILTHGRANRVRTYDTLMRQGYSGKVYIVIDDEDAEGERYRERFGEKVITFSKQDIANRYDTGDNFTEHRSVFFARNACFEIAKRLGVEYFLQLDDDYSGFYYKFSTALRYRERPVKSNLDKLFSAMLTYYKSVEAADTIAFCQNGDLIGGQLGYNVSRIWVKRKAMNTFFCSTSRPFDFVGRVNEDVNTYVSAGRRGRLMFTLFNVSIIQDDTQSNAGGMTELYLSEGTYIKSFYSVMYAPSAVKVSLMNSTHKRIHHRVSWENAVPKIVGEELVKRLQK